MNKAKQLIKYICFDLLAAGLSYYLFYLFRKVYIEPSKFGYDIPFEISTQFIIGLIFIPIFWIFLHLLSGYYRNPLRKSRLHELWMTFLTTLIGMLILFFVLLLDDWVGNYKQYYITFSVYFGLQFITTYIPRLVITRTRNP